MQGSAKPRRLRPGYSTGERVYDIVVVALVLITIIILMYPIVYILSNSISDTMAVQKREVWLLPKGVTTKPYEQVFKHQYLPGSMVNSIVYSVLGTAWAMLLTILGAYPLSRKHLPGRNWIMMVIAFTMIFNGGLIPTYLVVNSLGMRNSITAMIFPCAVSAYNLILMRTFFSQVPDSLEESARLDGANDFVILTKIFLPLSVPAMATVGLFYFIAKWNDFLNPFIYLSDKVKFPLQLILREMLIVASDKSLARESLAGASAAASLAPFGFKCAIIIVSILPLAVIYPFLQRYFVQGIMIGSVKG